MLQYDVPLVVEEDNQACIGCVKNGGAGLMKYLAKHPGINLQWLTGLFHGDDRVKQFSLQYCDTKQQLADGFTKPLDGPAWIAFLNGLGIQNSKA